MESRKRKASNATPSSTDGSASKKLRLLNSSAAPRSNVQDVGYRIVKQLQEAQDKSGRYIATEFLELPDQDELPEYYDFIKLPIALDTIEDKVKRNEYATITTIESDLKRMISNAKEFNDDDSQIFQDAERIRKQVDSFMRANNPAYSDGSGYKAFPTPIPSRPSTKIKVAPMQNGTHDSASSKAPSTSRQASEKVKAEETDRKPSVAPSATTGDADGDVDGDEDEEGGASEIELDLNGKTFQEAQQAIVSFLLRYADEEGLEIYSPFGNLPSRKLEDYYKLIRHPVSLKSVAKRARGQHGRAPPTGVTDFKTWDMFEDEMSFIWRNAKEYNEDGSDMFQLATEFEEHFKTLLTEAREKVDEPSKPTLKIGGPKPKVMLNLAQHNRGSPSATGVHVDNEALARQRQIVQAGARGEQMQHSAANGLARSTSQISINGARPSSSAHSGSPIGTAVKSESAIAQSPAPPNIAPAVQPLTNGMMPPPTVRPLSGSPFPAQPVVNNFHYTSPAFLPPTQLRAYPRENALLPKVTISTHPQLKIPKAFSMSITPHATLSHQSTTTTFPSSHYFLQIQSTISQQLSRSRPYKIFVSVNGTRLTQRDTQLHAESGKRTHVYEGSLAQGVNRIEVEVAAAKEGDEKGLDVEKVTVFANLMKER